MDTLLPDFKFKAPLVQRWSDTDAIGHVNNANYLTYFEEARVAYLEEILHWDWTKWGMLVAKAVIDFKAPLLYQEKAEIYTRIARIGSKSFDIEYAIVVNDTTIKATGTTVMVFFDYAANKSVVIPDDLRALMEKAEKR